ncbi:MAG: hypothetical protein ACK5LL_13490 [Suipraeoptans sp.]
MNSAIYVEGDKAQIGLVNSVGSPDVVSIEIYNSKTEDKYYTSEKITPGSLLHIAVLNQTIDSSEDLVLDYTMYDADGKESGKFQVDVAFIVSEDVKEISN